MFLIFCGNNDNKANKSSMDNIDFIENLALDVVDNSIIKVIGVGGGGCNAVNYMYKQGIQDVSFLVCNTDSMALEKMSVPAKLQLGQGLGAGGRPEVAEQFAQESKERIKEALNDGTKMVFITAFHGFADSSFAFKTERNSHNTYRKQAHLTGNTCYYG